MMIDIVQNAWSPSKVPSPKCEKQVTWLDVRYADRGVAKSLGAQWDGTLRKWYVPAGVEVDPELQKWNPDARTFLRTEFGDRNAVKALGARWCPSKMAWYITPDMEKDAFTQWLVPVDDETCELGDC